MVFEISYPFFLVFLVFFSGTEKVMYFHLNIQIAY